MTEVVIRAHRSLIKGIDRTTNSSVGKIGHTPKGRTIQECSGFFTVCLRKVSTLFTPRDPHGSQRGREATVSTPSAPEQRLAIRNQKSGAALLKLGLQYETGQGVPQSDQMAVACYRTAAGQG